MAVTTVIAASSPTPKRSVGHQSWHGHSPASSHLHPSRKAGSFLDRFCGVFSPGKKSPALPSRSPEGMEIKATHVGRVNLPSGKTPPPSLLVEAETSGLDGGGGGGGENHYLGRVFQYLDEDGDGKISPSELRSCMKTVGEELSEEDAEEVVESTDSDGDGFLGFEDFVKLVEVKEEEERTRDLRVAFSMYAAVGEKEGKRRKPEKGGDSGAGNNEECITPKSLREMLAKLGEWKSLDECRAMIKYFDLNGDGVLSFDEFRIMML